MKKLLLALAGATALISTSAIAAPTITYEVEPSGNFGAFFGNLPRTASFTDTYQSFTVTVAGLLSGQIGTTGPTRLSDIDFTSAVVSTTGRTIPFMIVKEALGSNPDGYESGDFAVLIDPGTYFIRVVGTVASAGRSTGSYSGTLNFISSSSVPEPATWALMIAGFGAVGFAMRRQRSTYRIAYS